MIIYLIKQPFRLRLKQYLMYQEWKWTYLRMRNDLWQSIPNGCNRDGHGTAQKKALGVMPGLRCLFCTETFWSRELNCPKSASVELKCSVLLKYAWWIFWWSGDLWLDKKIFLPSGWSQSLFGFNHETQ